jgi:hypothetical protein
MGIEPTDHMISMRSNSFEDYGPHQQYKHFQIIFFPPDNRSSSPLKSWRFSSLPFPNPPFTISTVVSFESLRLFLFLNSKLVDSIEQGRVPESIARKLSAQLSSGFPHSGMEAE